MLCNSYTARRTVAKQTAAVEMHALAYASFLIKPYFARNVDVANHLCKAFGEKNSAFLLSKILRATISFSLHLYVSTLQLSRKIAVLKLKSRFQIPSAPKEDKDFPSIQIKQN